MLEDVIACFIVETAATLKKRFGTISWAECVEDKGSDIVLYSNPGENVALHQQIQQDSLESPLKEAVFFEQVKYPLKYPFAGKTHRLGIKLNQLYPLNHSLESMDRIAGFLNKYHRFEAANSWVVSFVMGVIYRGDAVAYKTDTELNPQGRNFSIFTPEARQAGFSDEFIKKLMENHGKIHSRHGTTYYFNSNFLSELDEMAKKDEVLQLAAMSLGK